MAQSQVSKYLRSSTTATRSQQPAMDYGAQSRGQGRRRRAQSPLLRDVVRGCWPCVLATGSASTEGTGTCRRPVGSRPGLSPQVVLVCGFGFRQLAVSSCVACCCVDVARQSGAAQGALFFQIKGCSRGFAFGCRAPSGILYSPAGFRAPWGVRGRRSWSW
jgi:hypothetical protein